MTIGYVLINCELGAETDLIEKLKEVEQVKDAFATFGAHDIMVKIEGDHLEHLKEVINWQVKNLDKIRSTVTLVKK